MKGATIAISGVLIFLFLLGVGVIVLQIFLSKKESKWAGLILPIISLMISIIAVLGIATFSVVTRTGTVVENGVVIEQALSDMSTQQTMGTRSLIVSIISVFLLYNIPTAVLLAIYFGCREKQRQRKALAKMQAQDLE